MLSTSHPGFLGFGGFPGMTTPFDGKIEIKQA
jgi:hypothetical protein